jgi:hypothetical protein
MLLEQHICFSVYQICTRKCTLDVSLVAGALYFCLPCADHITLRQRRLRKKWHFRHVGFFFFWQRLDKDACMPLNRQWELAANCHPHMLLWKDDPQYCVANQHRSGNIDLQNSSTLPTKRYNVGVFYILSRISRTDIDK